MKTKLLTLVTLFMLLATIQVKAENRDPQKELSTTVAQVIKNNLSYPQTPFGERPECCVWVEITISDDGKFIVTQYNGNNTIKQEVIREIENLTGYSGTFKNYAQQKVALKIKFHLK